MLSIVIPTFNAAEGLAPRLEALESADLEKEVIVVDGGSTDATLEVAARAGARIVPSVKGRGAQLAQGAAAARGEWHLFLHADTTLENEWAPAATRFCDDPANVRRAAAFTFALDDASPSARRLERVVAWRSAALSLPYGDQGLLISRAFYSEIGGFRPLPLMEDVDIVRRIGRQRMVLLPVRAITSAGRYRRDGYVARALRNALLLALYFAGISPSCLARHYQ